MRYKRKFNRQSIEYLWLSWKYLRNFHKISPIYTQYSAQCLFSFKNTNKLIVLNFLCSHLLFRLIRFKYALFIRTWFHFSKLCLSAEIDSTKVNIESIFFFKKNVFFTESCKITSLARQFKISDYYYFKKVTQIIDTKKHKTNIFNFIEVICFHLSRTLLSMAKLINSVESLKNS